MHWTLSRVSPNIDEGVIPKLEAQRYPQSCRVSVAAWASNQTTFSIESLCCSSLNPNNGALSHLATLSAPSQPIYKKRGQDRALRDLESNTFV